MTMLLAHLGDLLPLSRFEGTSEKPYDALPHRSEHIPEFREPGDRKEFRLNHRE
jgi:hypothetical protein